MDARCPFCWNRNVVAVGRPLRRSSDQAACNLMVCGDCEKWFWPDSGEEVVKLFEICETSIINPSRCFDEVRLALNSGGSTFPHRRVADFNQVCSDCLNARFSVAKKNAHA